MLPELLFSVGSSMQDISREDFSLLNGGCDKDNLQLITGNDCTLERIKLGHTPDIEPSVSIKLEEPDIYPWHSTTDIGSNLLRHSDDPLISGAIDDNQNEFNPIKTSSPIQSNGSCTIAPQNHIRSTARSPSTNRNTNNNINKINIATVQPTTSSNSATPTNNKKPSRTRRKGQFKLRFHHQALPQEYLDHYEAAQNNLQKKEAEQVKLANQKAAAAVSAISTPSASSLSSVSAAAAVIEVNEQAARKHDSVRNWLQKISEYQHESSSVTPQPSPLMSAITPEALKLDPLLTMNDCSASNTPAIATTISTGSTGHINLGNNQQLKKQPPMSSRMVSYNDLPYMGEMTLDNCKPRRGRKPKKADICHLIYKNYGTILPGTPKEMRENNERSQSEGHHQQQHHHHHQHNDLNTNSTTKNIITADTIGHSQNKSTAQTKLLGSLLEKRLTNENNRKTPLQLSPSISPSPSPQTPIPSTPTIALKITEENIKLIVGKSEEPLNLCVRDRSETLSVSSEDTESCFFDASSIRTSPLILPSETDTLLAANFKLSLPNFQTAMMDEMSSCTTDNLLLPSTSIDPTLATTTGIMIGDPHHHHHQQQPSTSATATPPPPPPISAATTSTPPPGYVYWPAAGVFIHPMTLYYQKIVDANVPSTSISTTPIRLPRVSPVPLSGSAIGNTTSIPTTQSLIINTPAVSPSAISMPSPSSSSISSSSPVTNVISLNRHDGTAKILIPKNISQLLKQEKLPPPSQQIPSDTASSTSSKSASTSSSISSGTGGASISTATTIATTAPQKRKRSAIFIPPMPVESSSSHATEVSICKFKFTGGAKPSLQEKKMLSVDSGGNFRYYSGTGDKSMRGYEFFPRESLQQSSLLAGSSAGAFLNTPGEKIDLPPPSHGLSNEILQIPELPSIPTNVSNISAPISRHNQHHNYQHHKSHASMHLLSTPPSPSILSESSTPSSPQPPVSAASVSSIPPSQLLSSIKMPPSSSPITRQHSTAENSSNRNSSSRHRSGDHSDRRKRKSRRSLQRENLEKTFKEKGFLIQTQQLESAEGATYCKFRQLRKFTRYLFRSWKDYLPGELQQGQSAGGGSIPTHLVDGIVDPSMLMAAATSSGSNGGGTVPNQSLSPTTLLQQQHLQHQYPTNIVPGIIGKGNTHNSILHSPNIIKSSPSPT